MYLGITHGTRQPDGQSVDGAADGCVGSRGYADTPMSGLVARQGLTVGKLVECLLCSELEAKCQLGCLD